jgi:hypothetical protein
MNCSFRGFVGLVCVFLEQRAFSLHHQALDGTKLWENEANAWNSRKKAVMPSLKVWRCLPFFLSQWRKETR